MKMWFFVTSLTCRKRMLDELVTKQRVEIWLGCHRRAFEHFGYADPRTSELFATRGLTWDICIYS